MVTCHRGGRGAGRGVVVVQSCGIQLGRFQGEVPTAIGGPTAGVWGRRASAPQRPRCTCGGGLQGTLPSRAGDAACSLQSVPLCCSGAGSHGILEQLVLKSPKAPTGEGTALVRSAARVRFGDTAARWFQADNVPGKKSEASRLGWSRGRGRGAWSQRSNFRILLTQLQRQGVAAVYLRVSGLAGG